MLMSKCIQQMIGKWRLKNKWHWENKDIINNTALTFGDHQEKQGHATLKPLYLQSYFQHKLWSTSCNLLFYSSLSNQDLISTMIGKSVNNRTILLEASQFPPVPNTNSCVLITHLPNTITKSSTLKLPSQTC